MEGKKWPAGRTSVTLKRLSDLWPLLELNHATISMKMNLPVHDKQVATEKEASLSILTIFRFYVCMVSA